MTTAPSGAYVLISLTLIADIPQYFIYIREMFTALPSSTLKA
jgi:hypothetical protein